MHVHRRLQNGKTCHNCTSFGQSALGLMNAYSVVSTSTHEFAAFPPRYTQDLHKQTLFIACPWVYPVMLVYHALSESASAHTL